MRADSPRQTAALSPAIEHVTGQGTSRHAPSPVQGRGQRTLRHRSAVLAVSAAAVLAMAVLLTHVLTGGGGTGQQSTTNQSANTLAVVSVDPALAVLPRTVVQAAEIGGMHLVLVANPVVPGDNHLTLSLTGHGGAIRGADVHLIAAMVGMPMEPLTLSATEAAPGHYQASGLLSMFGYWQVIARIDRTGRTPITQTFYLSLNLPRSG